MSEISSYSQMQKDFVKWLKDGKVLEEKELKKVDEKTATTKYEAEFKEFLAQYKVHEQDFQVNMIDIEKEYQESLDKDNKKKSPLMEMFNDIMSSLKGNKKVFEKVDTDKNGEISAKEASNFFTAIAGLDGNDKSVSLTDILEATQVKDNKISFTTDTTKALDELFAKQQQEEAMEASMAQGAGGAGNGNGYIPHNPPPNEEEDMFSINEVNLSASTIEEVDKEIANAQANKDRLAANKEAAISYDAQQKEVISQEQAQLDATVAQIDGLGASLEGVKANITKNEKAITENKSSLENKTNNLESANTSLSGINSKLSSLHAPNSSDFTDKNGKINNDAYNSALNAYNNQKAGLERAKQGLMEDIERLQKEINELELAQQQLYADRTALYTEQAQIIVEKTGAESAASTIAMSLATHVQENEGLAFYCDILESETVVQDSSLSYLKEKRAILVEQEEAKEVEEKVEEDEEKEEDSVG